MFKLSFQKQVLAGFITTLIFVFISAVISYFSLVSLKNSEDEVDDTNDKITTIQQTKIILLNAETSLRGFLLNKDAQHYAAYTQSIHDLLPEIDTLNELTKNDPEQNKEITKLKNIADLKIANLSERIKLPLDLKLAATGEELKLEFLVIANQLIKKTDASLNLRKDQSNNLTRQTILAISASALIIFCLVLILLRYIRVTFNQQKETEKSILKTNNDLAEISAQNEHNNWLLSGAAEINEAMRGQQEVEELASNIITKISHYIGASVAAFYIINERENYLYLSGTYAYGSKEKLKISIGQGLVGQSALEKKSKLISHLPADYIKINSGLGETPPKYLFLIPIIFENKTIAVAELGFISEPKENKLNLISNMAENIGIALNSAMAHLQLKQLFEQTQQQSEELSAQQEELRTTNDELMHKTEALQASEEELRVQQEELQLANAELEEKAQQLEERNTLINEAKEAISVKASELEVSNRYKSEFLANMSHELRTPLNSILILARILKENQVKNLTDDQIKYAGVIHNAGSDLLTLINDILDLSKIESGNVDLYIQNIQLKNIKENIESLFSETANQKNISFSIKMTDDVPENFRSDQSRIEQIIKNLLSNAFKFTPKHGLISLEIGLGNQTDVRTNTSLKASSEKPLYFSVIDNGIGIAAEKLSVIFEAFQQEDGSTSRKYGGTGLGLSISRELANILGGEIQVKSESQLGSTFTLYLPQNLAEKTTQAEKIDADIVETKLPLTYVPEKLDNGNTLLIVEDDETFAAILKDYAIEKGFNPILAHSGDVGLDMAINQLPDAIILDVMLPVRDGWSVLKELKSNPKTKHIPVHMMSAGDEKTSKARKEGAIGFLKKPIEKELLDQAFELLGQQHAYTFNNVLIIEDQVLQSDILTSQLLEKGAKVSQAYSGKEALEILTQQDFDCIILDLKLPDISGFDLLDEIKSNPEFKNIPVIINTAMELDKEKMAHIMEYTDAMVLKTSKSNDRLLDEVGLFINKLQNQSKPTAKYPTQQNSRKHAGTLEKALKNKNILITDDDMRNIFALSSALQAYEINITIANNGKEALKQLEDNPAIDLVLMDIMMPEMDGYEAIRQIRLNKKTAKLPIIALTAKAMKNDREKCIEAGANDYVSKPVDVDKLLSMLRVWLS